MTKSTRKLVLRTQTLRSLTDETLRGVVGGIDPVPATGFIMKDTIIIRTGGVVSGATVGCP